MRTVRWMMMATLVALALSGMLGAGNPVHAQRLTWLGTLGHPSSVARGVSDNGDAVAGWFTRTDGKNFAFRWTLSGGMQNLGTLPQHTTSEANGISGDGNRIVGVAFYIIPYGGSWRAFMWTPQDGIRDLGNLPGSPRSRADAISGNGLVVVGTGEDYGPAMRAFRWTSGSGMQSLGTLGGSESHALGVSRDGSVVVGWSFNHLSERWAFAWKLNSGMRGLYPLAACCGEAYGVSDDGLVIAGRSHSATTERWHACLWVWNVSDYSPHDLGTLGGDESLAYACTNNQIAVGWSHNASGQRRAFRWTPEGGMIDLSDAYSSLLSADSYLEVAYDITPDGRFIVGRGYNAEQGRFEAFLLDTLCTAHNGDINRDGCVDDADLLMVLFAFGATGVNPADVNCDGTVDDADLLMVLFHFGNGC